MLNQSRQSRSTMGKCTPMQPVIARTMESFNFQETKMFHLTHVLLELEFIGIYYEMYFFIHFADIERVINFKMRVFIADIT